MKKNLVGKAIVLGLMTATVWSFGMGAAFAEQSDLVGHHHKDEQIEFQKKDIGDGLQDPNLVHNDGRGNYHTDKCGEQVDDTSLTIGDINKVVDTLVKNDTTLNGKINDLNVKIQDIEKNGTGKDTHVQEGIYKADADGTVTMPIEGSDGSVVINDVASAKGLKDETNRAKGEEKRIEEKFNEDVKRLNQKDGELGQAINDEVKRATDADAAHEAYMGTANDKGEDLQHIKKEENLSKNVGDLDRAITAETAERKAEVSRLDSRIDKLDGRVEKVGAMAAAMASLHTMGYDPAAPTEIAVGVGQYRDKTGFALGAFHYPNKNFMLNVSVSTAGDEFMAGIGATWKIGRRSPEAMLKAEQEKAARQALAKAEAEKQAAKDARVAAQAARHAKMLAERGL